jgi:uncharacterized protein YfbU (UPF0304 family)
MKLTNPEKLILVMLADIYDKLDIQNSNGIDTKLITDSIYSDNTWALSWELSGIVGDSPDSTPPEVNEVVDVLDMWDFIEETYASFNDTEKKKIEVEAEPFGKHVQFTGFDGNHETTQLSIAKFLIEKMDRFSRFKGRDLNSHCRSIDAYRRMLAAFEPIRTSLIDHSLTITTDQIIGILKAKKFSG